jgi:hypothetical protein
VKRKDERRWVRLEQGERQKTDIGPEIGEGLRETAPICDIEELENSARVSAKRTKSEASLGKTRFREKGPKIRRTHGTPPLGPTSARGGWRTVSADDQDPTRLHY